MPRKTKLTPLEREARNYLICYLSRYGLTNLAISMIMNTSESTVSRVIDAEERQDY